MSENKIIATEESLHLLCMLWAKEANITSENNNHFLELKNIDRKILYSTSRPKKVRGFIEANKVIKTWVNNNDAFLNEKPEIAFEYTTLKPNADGITNAISIDLSSPVITKENTCKFKLCFRNEIVPDGKYDDISLFIDWLPTFYCPKPIALLLPELAEYYK